jgi:DnaJ-class molecular chaperone
VAHDYYKTLGLARDAAAAEIKAAYRKLALQFHPDRNPGDHAAEERFKEVSQAYAVLGDEEKRARYDRWGMSRATLPFGDSADLAKVTEFFDAIFRRPVRTRPQTRRRARPALHPGVGFR